MEKYLWDQLEVRSLHALLLHAEALAESRLDADGSHISALAAVCYAQRAMHNTPDCESIRPGACHEVGQGLGKPVFRCELRTSSSCCCGWVMLLATCSTG